MKQTKRKREKGDVHNFRGGKVPVRKLWTSPFFAGVVFLFAGYLFASPEDFVARVEISGNKTVKTKKINKEITVRAGDIFSEEVLLGDVKRIYGMEKFEDVLVDISTCASGAVIRFDVKEKPRLRKFKFVGNKEVSKGMILEKIILSGGDYFSVSDVMNEIRVIQDLYKEEGFPKVSVSHFIDEPDKKGKSVVTFYIEEGKKILVSEINLPGVKSYSVKKIKSLMELKKKKIFNAEKLDPDTAKIKEFYKNRGYARFEISQPYISYSDDGGFVKLTLFVYERGKYNLGDVKFEGAVIKDSAKFADIMKESKFKKGRAYSRKNEERFTAAVNGLYADDGYLKLLLVPEYSYEDGRVNILYKIHEGSQININSIYIEGARRTKEFVIRREIRVNEGDPFRLTEVRESQRRILNLGFFSDVQIVPTDTHIPDKMDLTFQVQEQQTGMLSIGAGYSSVDRLVGTMQISETNFRGMGQKLSLMWEFGARRKNYNLSFTEPYFFGKNLSFNASVYDIDRVKEYVSSSTVTDKYNEHKRGGSIGFGKRFLDIYNANITYAYESLRLYGTDDVYMLEQKAVAESRGITSSVRTSLTRDTRDYFWDPTTGSIYKFSEETALGIFGGQNFFHRERLQISYFFPIVWKLVFVTNFEAGVVTGYGTTPDVPVYERFYTGGGESIRGYDYRGEIGPSEGGRFMNVNNFELKFPLVRENNQTVLQWAFFFDCGGAWVERDDIQWSFGESEYNFKRGWGMGIRFKIPAFPVRLDWAKGLDHVKGEAQTQWYFTIGDIFW
ncbi:MAG: outer membrane protein assembly factor BamA [Elusimicrobiota bacterium]|nr:outer membrane protein assembly factor BamA [Elusimicrobiota bacterium]